MELKREKLRSLKKLVKTINNVQITKVKEKAQFCIKISHSHIP